MELVVKTRDGTPVTHDVTKNTVRMVGADGEAKDFISADDVPEIVENIPIDLDFSGGDQTILAPEGTAVKSAILQKPDTLIPSNIAEGVDIAGITGTLLGGGGNVVANAVSQQGASACTVEHGLGVTPDIAIALAQASTFKSSSYYFLSLGISAAAENAGILFPLNMGFFWSSGGITRSSKIFGIDYADTSFPIYNANSETVTFSKLSSSHTYSFYFIGGLT